MNEEMTSEIMVFVKSLAHVGGFAGVGSCQHLYRARTVQQRYLNGWKRLHEDLMSMKELGGPC